MTSQFSKTFHQYMVSQILASNIIQDGGQQCYNEIPFLYHTAFVIVLSAIHIAFIIKWRKLLNYTVKETQPSAFQKRMALLCLLAYIFTLYFKIKTKKGLFIFNPCHITILIQIYLMFNKNHSINRIIYSYWSAWLFGPYMATFIPHLNGIDQFEVILYFFQHIAIVPIGYLILNKRYGFMKPTLKNQLAAFSSIALYQFLVLAPLSRSTMVNLNFSLCHSPADPSFSIIGIYYFVVCTLFLNIFSYLARWVSYIQIRIVYGILAVFNIKGAQIIEQSMEIQTPFSASENKIKKSQ